MANIPLAVQMYTLRDMMEKQFVEAFEQVAAIGYAGVEFGDGGPLSPRDFKRLLDGLDLRGVGVHASLESLEKDAGKVADFCDEVGVKIAICPYVQEARRKTAEDWAALGRTLGGIGRALKQRGLAFCYHNHDFEFQKFNGQYAMDILFTNAETPFVQAELDTYWIQRGGANPVAYLQKFAGRAPLLHCKDMAAGPEKRFAPVGTGVLDWPAIFQAAVAAGVRWYVVEQDQCYETPPLEALRASFQSFQRWGMVDAGARAGGEA